MGLVAKLLRLLPNAVFDRAFARRQRKPRAASMAANASATAESSAADAKPPH
jgi:hypothetical protein